MNEEAERSYQVIVFIVYTKEKIPKPSTKSISCHEDINARGSLELYSKDKGNSSSTYQMLTIG